MGSNSTCNRELFCNQEKAPDWQIGDALEMGSSIAVLGLRRTCWAHVLVHAGSGWGKKWRFAKKHSIDPDRRIVEVHSPIHLLCLCARCRLVIVKFVLSKSATSWMLPGRNVSFFRRWSISDLLLLVEYSELSLCRSRPVMAPSTERTHCSRPTGQMALQKCFRKLLGDITSNSILSGRLKVWECLRILSELTIDHLSTVSRKQLNSNWRIRKTNGKYLAAAAPAVSS